MDVEGDKITVASTDDFASFLDYCQENKKPKVLSLKPSNPGDDSLQLQTKPTKPIDQLVQEELEK